MTEHTRDEDQPGRTSLPTGLAQGGQGGPADQLLEDGQEEVFSRAEVEAGASEHSANTGSDSPNDG